jgi:teichuronic acid biosynthesis glycosyltransferase TuaC
MLRLLVLSSRYPDAERPSLGNFVEQQIRALAARPGIEIEVVAPIGLPPFPLSLRRSHRPLRALPAEEIRHGLRIHRPLYPLIPYFPGRRPAVLAGALLPLLRRVRERFPFDLITAEFFWPDGPVAMRLAREFALPFTIKARGPDFERWANYPATRRPALEAAAAAARLLAVSGSLRSAMVAAGLPEDRIEVHRTGVDRSLFRLRDRAGAKTALKVEGPLLLTVGNLIPRKRQQLAIDALCRLEQGILIVVGDGPDRAMLEARVRALGLEDRVRLMGHVPHALLPFLYAAADVTVHTASMEGLANVWVESLACGSPVVATDAGGAREAIDRSEAGRVVAADPGAIAAAVRDILANPPAPDAVAACAQEFSWNHNAIELESFLRAAVAARS